jgi:hypothetical protein
MYRFTEENLSSEDHNYSSITNGYKEESFRYGGVVTALKEIKKVI